MLLPVGLLVALMTSVSCNALATTQGRIFHPIIPTDLDVFKSPLLDTATSTDKECFHLCESPDSLASCNAIWLNNTGPHRVQCRLLHVPEWILPDYPSTSAYPKAFFTSSFKSSFNGMPLSGNVYDSCDEALTGNAMKKGFYWVRFARHGILNRAILVKCKHDEGEFKVRILPDHRLFSVSGQGGPLSVSKPLTYAHREEILRAIPQIMSTCFQYIKYTCKNAEFFDSYDSVQTAWIGGDGQQHSYFPIANQDCDADTSASCGFSYATTPCKVKDNVLKSDAGKIANKEHLPVMELLIGDTGSVDAMVEFEVMVFTCL